MLSSIRIWLNVVLALVGPAIVAILGVLWSSGSPAIVAHLPGLLAIALIVLGVYAIAIYREGYTLHRLGFGQISRWTPLLALALATFFVVVFGPIANWMLARLGAGSFDAGLAATEKLPTAYLIVTIVLVASAEELLYRSYAIERLADLTGSYALAGIISLFAFGLAHVPMWGWAPAATTIVSGSVMTLVYIWRRDVVALALAHVATDLYGIVLIPHLARHAAD